LNPNFETLLQKGFHIKTIWIFLGFVFAIQLAYSQDTCQLSIYGHIIDADSHKPLPFAEIQIKELNKSITSDSNGFYSFGHLCSAKYQFEVKHFDCAEITQTVHIHHNIVQDFYLPHSHYVKGEVVVSAEHQKELSQNKIILTDVELFKASGTDLGQTLSKIPGISSLKTGSTITKPIVDGLHSQRVLIINNGIRQEGQQWGSEHAPEIDPFVSGKITVIKGAESVRYGADAIAGVILIEPRKYPIPGNIRSETVIAGFSNYKGLSGSSLIEGSQNIKNHYVSFRAQGTLKQNGNVPTPDYTLQNTANEEQNYSLSGQYKFKKWTTDILYSDFNTKIGIFAGSHIGNLADLQTALNSSKPLLTNDTKYNIDRPYQKINHELFTAKVSYQIKDRGLLYYVFGRQFNNRFEYDVLRTPQPNDGSNPQLNLKITTQSHELIYEQYPHHKFNLTSGIQYQKQFNTWEGRFLIPNFIGQSIGGFSTISFLGNHWDFEAGLRMDFKNIEVYRYDNSVLVNDHLNFAKPSASIGSIFKSTNGNFKWRNNLGTGFRPPSINELYSDGLHQGQASIEKGDKSLKSEIGLKYVSSIEISHVKWSLNGSIYYQYLKDFIYLSPSLVPEVTIRGVFPVFYYKQTNANIYGADVSGTKEIAKGIDFTYKLAYVNIVDLNTSKTIIFTPPARGQIGINWKITSKNRLLNKLSPSININEDVIAKQGQVPSNLDYTPPPKGYFLTNLGCSFQIPVQKQKILVFIGGENIFNLKYRDYLNRFRYYANEIGANYSLKIKIPLQILSK